MNRQSRDLIAYLLSKFEINLEPIVLIKLVYLSELEAVEKYGKRFTNLRFIHYKHGPYASELQSSYEKGQLNTISEEGKDPDLLAVVDNIVKKWKPVIIGGGIQGLINKTYHTLPFQETSFNDEINFENYKKNKYISKTVISKSQYKMLSNSNIKLFTKKELQASVDEFLEQFN